MTPIDFDRLREYGIVRCEPITEFAEVEREEDVDESSPYRHDWPEMPLGVSRG